MIGNMGDDRSYAFTIKFSNGLFLIAVPVLGPLKRKLHGFSRARQKEVLLREQRRIIRCSSGPFGFPARQPSGKSRKTVRGGLNAMPRANSRRRVTESLGEEFSPLGNICELNLISLAPEFPCSFLPPYPALPE